MPIKVVLPTLHAGQVAALQMPGRFKSIRCGRRFGKTVLLSTIACDGCIKSENIGIFAPDYKTISETYNEIADILEPVKMSSSKIDGVIRTITGGRIDFWTLENERAGRSRKYHKVLFDEAAHTKPNLMRIWELAISPTLLDYKGSAIAFSTPNGVNQNNFFWRICNEKKHGFVDFHAPTASNPFLPADEIEEYRKKYHPLVFQQEFLAEFVDWSGVAFFGKDHLLVDGQGVPYPSGCDTVFAVIDSAVKGGREHDGTAVTYWALSDFNAHKLICLDYDIISIDGALLEHWIPSVFSRLEELAKMCRARFGSRGAFIEDAASGSILLQQCALRGFPTEALPGDLTAAGKDARAINASSPVWRGEVKFSDYAYDKIVVFKEAERNHLASQVFSFRVGDKNANTRADDLLDTFTYAIAISLGDQKGIA